MPPALIAVGAAVAAGAAVQQGIAASNAAKFRARVAKQQAKQEGLVAAEEAKVFKRRQSRLLATSRALRAGSGVSTEGSPLLVDEATAAEIELGRLSILSGGETRATRLEQEARLAQSRGRSAKTGGFLTAGSTLLTGLAKASNASGLFAPNKTQPGGGCFVAGTAVLMRDRATRPIEALEIGDQTAGGRVTGVMTFEGSAVVDYNGIHVTHDHHVNDAGMWREVGNCADSRALPWEPERLYLVNTTERRVWVRGNDGAAYEFADYWEISQDHPIERAYRLRLLAYLQAETDSREAA